MGINGGIAAIDKESQLAEPSAVTDKFVNISMGKRRTGALECKICQMSVKFGFYRSCKSFNTLMILEVYRIGRRPFP